MRPIHWILILVAVSLALPGTALAWRCGNLIVNSGTEIAAVNLYCGQPVYRQRNSASSEMWVYGPEFGVYRVLHIRNGKVTKVETKNKI